MGLEEYHPDRRRGGAWAHASVGGRTNGAVGENVFFS